MNKKSTTSIGATSALPGLHFRRWLLAAGIALAGASALSAVEFILGEADVSVDSTLSYGTSYRLNNADPGLIGTTNGGLQNSVNADNGNLNYDDKGIFSNALKITSEFHLSYQNFGVFVRGIAFDDFENERNDQRRTPLSDEALEKVGQDIVLLDYFAYAKFDMGNVPVDIRVGSQVLSWGESTFIQNGINTINPFDVSKFRIAGAELKEGLIPVPMISASIGITENITLEGFYLFEFAETEIDPPGTYFSTNDFAGVSGNTVMLGFGAIPDIPANRPLMGLGGIPRAANNNPSDSGQFGLAARILIPSLNDIEVGLYFMCTHSRLPLISSITPATPIDLAGLQATIGSIVPGFLATGLSLEDAIAAATNAAIQQVSAQLGPVFLLTSAATGRYQISYPEDIDILGLSLNTYLGRTGISLQGEVSFHFDQPLQVDDVELLFATLGAITNVAAFGGAPIPGFPDFGNNNQLGNFASQLGAPIDGFRRMDVVQVQATATKVFGPTLGADQWILLGEFGVTHVPDLPAKDVLRFDGPGTFTSGNETAMLLTGNGAFPATPLDAFADGTSWGYRIVSRLDYLNLFWSVNAMPSIAFAHDVSGNTPLPIGNFLEGRKTLTLGVEFTYQNSWSYAMRYTNFYGAGDFNLSHDRDFFSVTLKYSF